MSDELKPAARPSEQALDAAFAIWQAEGGVSKHSVVEITQMIDERWKLAEPNKELAALRDSCAQLDRKLAAAEQFVSLAEDQIRQGDEINAELQAQCKELADALEACGVFVTPLEQLKGWGEYKEDAMRRRQAALAKFDGGQTK